MMPPQSTGNTRRTLGSYGIAPTTVAFAVVVTFSTGCDRSEPVEASQESVAGPVEVATDEAERVQIPETLELEGTLAAFRAASLSPLVSGHVSAIEVERGDVVAQGDPLVVLRATSLKLQASSAWARAQAQREQLALGVGGKLDVEEVPSVIAARSDRDLADDNLRRITALHESGAVDDRSFEQAKASVQAAEARYASAKQQATAAHASYRALAAEAAARADDAKNTTLRAPFAGAVVSRRAEVGEFVSPQQPIIELVDASKLRLEVDVPERSVEALRVGQKAEIRVDGSDARLAGEVAFMAAALDPERRTLTIEIVADNPEGRVRAGHFARARIELGTKRELVRLPAAAVQERAGVYRVYLVDGGRARARIVEVVERHGEIAFVRGEVASGTPVIVNPPSSVADGVAVRAE